MNVDDSEALAAFKGIGWHLLRQIKGGEEVYNGMMKATPGPPEVEGLLELFAQLNIDALFFQRPVPDANFAHSNAPAPALMAPVP